MLHRADPRALAVLLLGLISSLAAGQRMPPPSLVTDWISPHNQNRCKLDQQALPEFRSKQLPDGTERPPEAPWPFLLYVAEQEGDARAKIDTRLLVDTRVVLATRSIKLVRIRPEKALDLPYLTGVRALRDPSLLLIDRHFEVQEAFTEAKQFEERSVLPLLARLHDREYPLGLARFLNEMLDLMDTEEALWRDERRCSELQDRASRARGAQREKLDREAEELEAGLEEARDRLLEEEQKLLARLQRDEKPAAPPPLSSGEGKRKRPLSPEEEEAITAFREFARNDNPYVRAAAVLDLGSIDSGPMATFVLEAANDVAPLVVEAAGRALGRMSSDEALGVMQAALGDSNRRRQRAAILGFAEVSRMYPAAVPLLIASLNDPAEDIRHAVLQALRRQQHATAIPGVIARLDDSVPALRVLAAQTLGALRAGSATQALCEKLGDADWSLQKAAAEALGQIRSRDSIEPLLHRFEQANGIVVEAIYRSLVRITGQDFSLEPSFWRRWWDQYGDRFELPSDAEVERVLAQAKDAMARYTGPGSNSYHTITTLSRRLLFVIDVSASMAARIPIPANATPADLARFPSRVKMEIAKQELIELLAKLESDVMFNIITFAGDVEFWSTGLTGTGSRSAAIKFVSQLQPMAPTVSRHRGRAGGGEEQKTNTFAALEAAFGLAGSGADWKRRADADTIFLVTDGDPTTGEIVDSTRLIDHFTGLNMTRGLVIHLVTFDQHVASRLGSLATSNGGQCVVRGF